MAERSPIRLERDGDVASIVLDNPPLNLFGAGTFEGLVAAITEIERSDARAVVWRAEGETFSGGVDVHHFQHLSAEAGSEMMGRMLATVRRLEALPLPTLALVQGLCLTAGLEVALGCDMIWATDSAKFGLVEAVVGITPGAGGTQRFAERAGSARAREFVMTGGLYEAATLERWNVINRVVGDDELLQKGMRFAHRLAAGPTLAHAATKRILRAHLEGGVDRADRLTPETLGALFASEDTKAAVESFLEDGPGKATFEGR